MPKEGSREGIKATSDSQGNEKTRKLKKKQESFKFGRSQRRRKKYYSINKNCDTHSHTQRGKKTNKEIRVRIMKLNVCRVRVEFEYI